VKEVKVFGFHRAMDTSGAVIGLAIGALIIYLVQGGGINLELDTYPLDDIDRDNPGSTGGDCAGNTGKGKEKRVSNKCKNCLSASGITRGFEKQFWLFLVVVAIFTLGNSSDFFLILRAQRADTPLIQVMLMLVLFNATYAVISLPMGILSDKIGRRRTIAIRLVRLFTRLLRFCLDIRNLAYLGPLRCIRCLLRNCRRRCESLYCRPGTGQNGVVPLTVCTREQLALCSFAPVSSPVGCGMRLVPKQPSILGRV